MKHFKCLAYLILFFLHVHGQHDTMTMKMDMTMPMSHGSDTLAHNKSSMAEMPRSMGMHGNYSLQVPMNRDGSGTAWLPDASLMYGTMYHTKHWMYMLHGNLFLRYDNQDFSKKGVRGDSKFDAPDWIMLMGQRKVGKRGLFHFNTMLSLDALTGGNGYPLLFQTGESYHNKPLVDRQHPHDLFSELSVSYSKALSKKMDVIFYVGYPGEPALGPVAFMHRPSALDNPDAPITHHWVDATHVTYGVTTIGFRYDNFMLEVSAFTGKEPGENRYNFDKASLNSNTVRLSYNPTANWALQVSRAHLTRPEGITDVTRTTASAIYSHPIAGGSTDATVLWGQNKGGDAPAGNAFLLEASVRKRRLALHTRYEWVQKSTFELGLVSPPVSNISINSFTVGAGYDLLSKGNYRLASGGQWTIYHADARLNNLYGKNPMALEFYLRIYPHL